MTAPDCALVFSPESWKLYPGKVCGLYPLERLLISLARSGITRIYLNLSPEELAFYRARVKKTVAKIASVAEEAPSAVPDHAISLPSNLFVQPHYFAPAEFGSRFRLKKKTYVPIVSESLFPIESDEDIRKAAKALRRQILEGTSGYIARNINKRVSLPISMALSTTRVHPNYLTVFNMIIGFSSAFLILQDRYWCVALGGFMFQMASVFDGVDGEVAKLTLKVSKLGGWLDTISDNGTLLLFLTASSWLYFAHTGGFVALAVIGVLFCALAAMLAVMVSYLRRYTSSGSLVTYDKEFIQKLPESDPVVRFVRSVKYITKKEFFSIAFFAISLTGKIHLLVPIIAVVLVVSASCLIYLDAKYDKPAKAGKR